MQIQVDAHELKKEFRFYFTTGVGLLTAVSFWQTLKYQLRIIENKKKTKLIKSGEVSKTNEIK
jgi:hypothetical protein